MAGGKETDLVGKPEDQNGTEGPGKRQEKDEQKRCSKDHGWIERSSWTDGRLQKGTSL